MNTVRPPRLVRTAIEWWVLGPNREFIIGDLEEAYSSDVEHGGGFGALARYLSSGVKSGMGLRIASLGSGTIGDVKAAARQVGRSKGVYLAASLVLALGLGVGTFTWGIRYGSFVKGLPVSEPDRILTLQMVLTETREQVDFSLGDLHAIRGAGVVEIAALWSTTDVVLKTPDSPPVRTTAVKASPQMLDLLEFTPLLGRLFVAADAAQRSPPVMVLSYQLWARSFEANADVVGTTVEIDGRATTVVGVLPEGSRIEGTNELWLPIRSDENRTARNFFLAARSFKNARAPTINAGLSGIAAQLTPSQNNKGLTLELTALPFARAFKGPNTSALERVLYSSGVFMFLMALANASNLFIVQVQKRRQEFAVRQALGASSSRVFRQLVVEALFTAVVSIAGAAWIADAGLRWYQKASDAYAGGLGAAWTSYALESPHWIILVTGALSSTVAVTILASLPLSKGPTADSLRSSRGMTRTTFRLGRTLVAVEIAFGGALLLLASLMIESVWNLRTNDWGFATEGIITGSVALDGAEYGGTDSRRSFWSKLLSDLGEIPGVSSATLATQLPMIRNGGGWRAVKSVEMPQWELDETGRLPFHYVDAVSPDFFETFETGVKLGRAFNRSDDPAAEPVVIINEPFAARYFPDNNPLGRQMRIWEGDEPGPWRTVVGIAPHLWMDTDENKRPEGIYIPLGQVAPRESQIALRVAGNPASFASAIREIVSEADADLPVDGLRTMPELIDFRTRLYKRDGPIFVWLGLTALVLAVAGLYSVVSYMSSLRVKEFGVRAALGAGRQKLVFHAVSQELAPLFLGGFLGIALGLSVTQGFSRFMFLVEPTSPGTAATSLVVLLGGALLASLVPAFKASQVDLVKVLKEE